MMRKVNPLAAAFAVGSVVVLAGTVALAAPGSPSAVPSNPTQAQALEGLDTARLYIQQHPDAPLPTPSITATVPATETPQPEPTVNPSPTPTGIEGRASGLPWDSGVNPQSQHRNNVNAFASMRGRPVDVIVVFPARDSWSALNVAWAWTDPIPAGYKGRLSYSMPLWPGNGSVSANYNAEWTAFANRLEALDPKASVRLGWEMNLPSSYWKVTSANRAAWVAAFNRAAIAIHNAAPGLQVVFNPNWGGDQTGVDSRAVFQEVKANVDVYGIDYYDSWPAITSDAIAASRLVSTRGLRDSYNYAVANGKKFAVPEWGLGCNGSGCQWAGHAGGDNPRYIKHVLDFLKSVPASSIAYEAYFDEPASYIKSSLRAGTVNPNSAATYRTLITALAD